MALDAGKVVAILELDTSAFSGGMTTAQTLMERLKKSSMGVGDKMKLIGSAMQNTGKIMTAGLTLPIVAGGAAAVKTFVGFDDAMRQVQATMGLTGEEGAATMERLTQAAKDMGATTRYTASDSANALNYLALAGYDAEKAIEALPSVLRLAQAGGIELGYASDMVTDSMSALGMETSKLPQFVDELAKTSQKSNTNIAQLGEAILTVGGTAKSLAGGTVELNTALGILADNGIKGADGGTALRNILLALKNPTADAEKALKQYGISVYDAEGNMRGLQAIFGDLAAAMEGWTQEQKDELFTSIFNARDLKSAEALLANYGDRWTELSGQISGASGAATQMASAMEGGIGGSFRNLSSAVEGLAIEFGENLAPTVQSVADFVTNLVRGFTQLPESMQTTIVNIAAFVAAAGPAIVILGKLVSIFSSPIGLTVGIVGAVAALVGYLRSIDQEKLSIGRILSGTDAEKLSAFSEAFEDIETEVDMTATVNDYASDTVVQAVNGLKTTLVGIDVLSDAEREQIIQMIGDDIDPILAALNGGGIDTTTEEGASAASTITQAAITLHMAYMDVMKVAAGMDLPGVAELINQDKAAIIAALTAKGVAPEDADGIATQLETARKALEDAGVSVSNLDLTDAISNANMSKQDLIDALTKKGVDQETANAAAQEIMNAKDAIDKAADVAKSNTWRTIADAVKQDKDTLVDALTGLFEAAGEGNAENKAQTAADQIIAAKDALTKACSGMDGIVPEDMVDIILQEKSDLVTALAGLGLTEADTASLILSLTTAQNEITASVNSLYDDIYGKLTDGKYDTQAQSDELNQKVQAWYDDLMGKLNLNTESGQQYASDLQGLQDATLNYIETMSNASTSAVEQSKGELDALAKEAKRIKAEIDALVLEPEKANDNRDFRLVKAGATTDPTMVANAFGAAARQRTAGQYNAKDTAIQRRDAAYDKFDKGEYDQGELDAMIAKINADEQAALAQVEADYVTNLNALFEGLGSAGENVDATAALQGIVDTLNLGESMKDIGTMLMEGLDPSMGEEVRNQLVQKIQELLFDTGAVDSEAFDGSAADFLDMLLGNPQLQQLWGQEIVSKVAQLNTGAKESMKTIDMGGLGAAYGAAIEQELLAGIEGLDLSGVEGALAVLLGNIPVPTLSGGETAGEEYAEGIASQEGAAKDAASDVTEGAVDELGSGNASGSGSDLIAGFISGMGSKLSAVIEKARELARAAVDAINSEAEIASPSKKTMKTGGFFGDGFAKGIRSKISDVMAASSDMARAGLSMLNGTPTAGDASSASASTAAGRSITLNVNNPVVQSRDDASRLAKEIGRYTNHLSYGFGGT